jgi:serine O-acetyltransferase
MALFPTLSRDMQAALERDPASRNRWEVFFSYPGFQAVLFYRCVHWFWNHKLQFLGRFISHLGRFFTGIEIHPGAKIGPGFFVDHGMGVVIGETAVVGDDVHMYHGVTLGGDDPRPVKRHPTVEDHATLGANATLIGDINVGENATVGAAAVVTNDVPAGVTVAGNPAARVDEVDDGDDGDGPAE